MLTPATPTPLPPAPAGRGDSGPESLSPAFPPGRNWVRGRELDAAGTRLHVQLLNDAMAPAWLAGTWLAAEQVPAAGPLAPGPYLVRWPDADRAHVSFVGRLLPDGLEPGRLVFDFDGELPEPVRCSMPRTGRGMRAARLYRVRPLASGDVARLLPD